MSRSPSTAAERMRKFRRGRRYGLLSIRVRLAPSHIDALIKRGYLNPQDRGNQDEIEKATSDCIGDALFTS